MLTPLDFSDKRLRDPGLKREGALREVGAFARVEKPARVKR